MGVNLNEILETETFEEYCESKDSCKECQLWHADILLDKRALGCKELYSFFKRGLE